MRWEKYLVSPDKLHIDILKLIDQIPKGKYKNIYAVPRGGLIVGTYLSHHLDIPLLMNLFTNSNKDTLIVDDLTDTGVQLNDYYLSGFDTAVVYYKKRSKIVPTYYSEICPNDKWIVFQFEKFEEEPNREL